MIIQLICLINRTTNKQTIQPRVEDVRCDAPAEEFATEEVISKAPQGNERGATGSKNPPAC